MLVFEEMLISPAKNAGIEVPPNLQKYDKKDYPYWDVFCYMQLGTPMPYPTVAWDNANIIAQIPEHKIRFVSYKDIINEGFMI